MFSYGSNVLFENSQGLGLGLNSLNRSPALGERLGELQGPNAKSLLFWVNGREKEKSSES